jgi:hypothetical protein
MQFPNGITQPRQLKRAQLSRHPWGLKLGQPGVGLRPRWIRGRC